ncbi:MAG: hypothetical protein LUG83_05670 [Lachnospiraceae bacterium]|nr:hypothetical protein [Lachnospiraceae bacterium]
MGSIEGEVNGMKKDIKVEVKFTEGFRERFTEACVRVAMKRFEGLPEASEKQRALTGECSNLSGV